MSGGSGVVERGSALLGRMTGREGSVGIAALGTLGVSLFGTAIRFVLQVLLANWMTQTAYGLFIVARSWGELLAKIPNRGYQLSAVRYLPGYETEEDWPRYRGFVRRSNFETLLGGILIAVAATAIYAGLVDDAEISYVAGFALVPALAWSLMLRSNLQAAHRYIPALALTEIVQPVAFGICVGIAAVMFDLTPAFAITVWAASNLFVAVAQSIALRRWMPGPNSLVQRVDERKTWTRSARTDFVAQIAIAALQLADVIVVGWTLGEAEAALYGVATRIAVLGRIVNSGLESVVSPRITAAYRQGKPEEIQGIVDSTIRISTWPTLAFGLIVAAAATPLLRLFDEQYVDARTVLWVLLIGNLTNALTGPSGFVTSMTGAARPYAWIMSTHAIALVVGAYFVAGPWGIVGVAVVRSVVNASWNVILAVMAWKRLKVRCYPRFDTLVPSSLRTRLGFAKRR